ncbi:MAG: ATP-binding protein [Pseudomonadota bacterium]
MQRVYILASAFLLITVATIYGFSQLVLRVEDRATDRIELVYELKTQTQRSLFLSHRLLDTVDTAEKEVVRLQLAEQLAFYAVPLAESLVSFSRLRRVLGDTDGTAAEATFDKHRTRLARNIKRLAEADNYLDWQFYGEALRAQVRGDMFLEMEAYIEDQKALKRSSMVVLAWVQSGSIPLLLLVQFGVWRLLIKPINDRRRMATKALEKSQTEALLHARRAEMMSEAKTRFLATMSHELRTPLNGVIGMAQALEPTLRTRESKESCAAIRDSGEALMAVVNDILDFSKIEAGKLTLEETPFDPGDLVVKLGRIHGLRASEKGIGLQLTVTPTDPLGRLGDPHRVMQVLNNLVGNSVKFTETGQVSVQITAEPGDPLTLTIRDSGIGMTEDQVATIFEDFVQADSSTTRRFGGTGLGMSITQSLVNAMDGGIHVESEVGVGTTFTVTLPLSTTDRPVRNTAGPASATPYLIEKIAVLAADDNRTNRLVLSKMLDRLGLENAVAKDGYDAVRAAREKDYGIFLLDISMPGIDGIETLAALREDDIRFGRSPRPAIAVTANTMVDQIAHYKASGFAGHVAKPIKMDALATEMNRILAEYATEKPAREPAVDAPTDREEVA